MTREVVSVKSDTPLQEAAGLLARHGFDGMPVVDEENRLVGILTEYDLIAKASAIHLPTFQFLIQQLPMTGRERAKFGSEVAEISRLTVGDVMNRDPLTLAPEATFAEVVAAFRDHHRVNPIPVIDSERKVVGVISRFDVLRPLQELPAPDAGGV